MTTRVGRCPGTGRLGTSTGSPSCAGSSTPGRPRRRSTGGLQVLETGVDHLAYLRDATTRGRSSSWAGVRRRGRRAGSTSVGAHPRRHDLPRAPDRGRGTAADGHLPLPATPPGVAMWLAGPAAHVTDESTRIGESLPTGESLHDDVPPVSPTSCSGPWRPTRCGWPSSARPRRASTTATTSCRSTPTRASRSRCA